MSSATLPGSPRPPPRSTCFWSMPRWARSAASSPTCPPRSGRCRSPASREPPRGGWASWAPRSAASSPAPRPWHRGAGTGGSPIPPGPRTRCCGGWCSSTWPAGRPPSSWSTDADLDPRDRKRVQFFLENLVEALAPSNVPLVNPASAKAAIDTAGLSLVRGGKQLVRDLASAPRMPEMVDGSGFVGGREHRRDPGRGRVPHRGARADPVRAADRARSTRCRCWSSRRRSTSTTRSTSPRSAAWSSTCVRQGQQVFVDLLAQPGRPARRTGTSTPTCAPVLDALRRRRARSPAASRRCSVASCSGGILASMAAAYLAGIGRQDRLAALVPGGHRARQPRRRDGGRARRRRGWPRRPRRCPRASGYLDGRDAGRGVRLAAARRPGLELLGQQLPARQATAGVRHPVLERRHHPDDRRAARRLRRPGDGELADPARRRSPCSASPIDLGKITVDSYVVAGITDHITPWENCYRSAQLLGGDDPVRAVHQRPHRGPGQPAGQPQGDLPDQRRHHGRRQGRGSKRRRRPPGQLVDRLVGRGSTSAAGAQRPAPEQLGVAPPARRSRRRPAPTSSTTEAATHERHTVDGHRPLARHRLLPHRRPAHRGASATTGAAPGDFVDDEVLPGHQRLLGARRVPVAAGRAAGRARASSATGSRATAARR